MGGDNAPDEIVAGALEAASESIQPILCGPPGLDTSGLELIEAPQTIAMDEKPAEAVREKPDSSLVACCRAVADGKADVALSAGNTGAMLAASLVYIRRLSGVRRPAIAVVLPSQEGPSLLLDAGANAEARPEHLLQFGQMGAIFAREVLDVAAPAGAPALHRGGAGEGQQAHPRGVRAAGRNRRPRLPRQRREPRPPAGRRRRHRHGRLHGQRQPEAARGNDQDAARRAPRGDHVDDERQARRLPDPARRPRPAGAPRPGHVRRRVPARPARPGRDRPRKLEPRARFATPSAWPLAAPSTTSCDGSRKGWRNAW